MDILRGRDGEVYQDGHRHDEMGEDNFYRWRSGEMDINRQSGVCLYVEQDGLFL